MKKSKFTIFMRPCLERIKHALAATALHTCGGVARREILSGNYGEVIITRLGPMIGDLCYMREGFGWTHAEYMGAYGYTTVTKAKKGLNSTDGLNLHTFKGKHILIIPNGGDGFAPLGLGCDTGALAVVGEDHGLMLEVHRALVDVVKLRKPELDGIVACHNMMEQRFKENESKVAKAKLRSRSEGCPQTLQCVPLLPLCRNYHQLP